MLRPVALPSAPPTWIWSYSWVRKVSASTVEPPAHTRPVRPAAVEATFSASAGVRPSSGFGGFTFTKSAPRQRATPAAPAMRSGSFSAVTALPRG